MISPVSCPALPSPPCYNSKVSSFSKCSILSFSVLTVDHRFNVIRFVLHRRDISFVGIRSLSCRFCFPSPHCFVPFILFPPAACPPHITLLTVIPSRIHSSPPSPNPRLERKSTTNRCPTSRWYLPLAAAVFSPPPRT